MGKKGVGGRGRRIGDAYRRKKKRIINKCRGEGGGEDYRERRKEKKRGLREERRLRKRSNRPRYIGKEEEQEKQMWNRREGKVYKEEERK